MIHVLVILFNNIYLRITLAIVLSLIALLVIFLIVVNLLQNKKPFWLPIILRNWNFLPIALRSLEPYDRIIMKYILCCKQFKSGSKISPDESEIKEANLPNEQNKSVLVNMDNQTKIDESRI